MQINDTMDLNQLPELIEKRFNPTQMNRLCTLLNETKYASLEELPPEVWASILELVHVEHPHS
jgi:hypothetical protein